MPVTTLLTRGSATGHLFTDPSRDGGVTYWADVWFDDGSGLHGAVWRRDAAGQPREATDESAFHPSATAGALVWVEVAPQALARMSPAAGTPPADADQVLLNQLNGSLQARDVKSGRQWQVSDRADVASVARGGSLVLWRSDSQSHVYDLHARASSPLEAQVRGARLRAILRLRSEIMCRGTRHASRRRGQTSLSAFSCARRADALSGSGHGRRRVFQPVSRRVYVPALELDRYDGGTPPQRADALVNWSPHSRRNPAWPASVSRTALLFATRAIQPRWNNHSVTAAPNAPAR